MSSCVESWIIKRLPSLVFLVLDFEVNVIPEIIISFTFNVQEYKEKITVVKIDHDASPKLIEEYKVYGLPTLILFKDGKEVPDSKREGAITKVKLKEYLDGLLKTVSIA